MEEAGLVDPDAGGAFDGAEDAWDPDEEAWALAAAGAQAGQQIPGVSRATRDRLRRIQAAGEVPAGIVPASRWRWRLRVVRRWVRMTLIATAAILAVSNAYSIADGWLHPYSPPPRTQNWRPVDDPLLALAQVRDPEGRGAWGMRVRTKAGTRCVTMGRLRAGRVGLRSRGRFEEFAAGAPERCLPKGVSSMVWTKDYGPTTGRRSVAYGLAAQGAKIHVGGADPSSLLSRGRDGELLFTGHRPPGRLVAVRDDGTFIYVAVGVNSLASRWAYVDDGHRVVATPLGLP